MINGRHELSYCFEVLRDGIRVQEVRAARTGDIYCSADAEIKRSVSCSLYLPEGVDLLRDELRVSLILDGVKTPLGIFTVTTMPRSVSSDGVTVYRCEGYDRGYRVQSRRIERRSEGYIAAGTKYTDAVQSFLLRSGIQTVLIPDSPLTLSKDREDWDVGESFLTIVNTLLGEINYTSLWFDRSGVARSEPYTAPTERVVRFTYQSGKDAVVRAHSAQDDYFGAHNVFTVGVSNSDTDPIFVTEVNDSLDSRISTVYRGRIAAPVVMLDGAPSEDEVRRYAQNLVLKSRISTETASIQTAPEAGHEVGDAVSLSLPEISGKFEEIGWTLPLDGSLMTHELRRAVYV